MRHSGLNYSTRLILISDFKRSLYLWPVRVQTGIILLARVVCSTKKNAISVETQSRPRTYVQSKPNTSTEPASENKSSACSHALTPQNNKYKQIATNSYWCKDTETKNTERKQTEQEKIRYQVWRSVCVPPRSHVYAYY